MCRCVHVSDSLILGGEAVGEGGGRPSSAGGGGEIREKIPGPAQLLRKISGGKTKFRGAQGKVYFGHVPKMNLALGHFGPTYVREWRVWPL